MRETLRRKTNSDERIGVVDLLRLLFLFEDRRHRDRLAGLALDERGSERVEAYAFRFRAHTALMWSRPGNGGVMV